MSGGKFVSSLKGVCMIQISNLDIETVRTKIMADKAVLFSAGDKAREFCETQRLAPYISCIADNFRAGDNLSIRGVEIPIVSYEEAAVNAADKLLLITSLKYADEIIMQLNGMKQFDERKVYIQDMLSPVNSPAVRFLNKSILIPKTIHYCWFGGNSMPEEFKRNIDTWRRMCPDYEIVEWTEKNYDVGKNRYMKQAYEKKKWGFVADYARIDIINECGGIYLDTDVEVVKPLDNLLTYRMFCGFENYNYVNFGLGYGSEAKHPILLELLKLYAEMEFVKEDGNLNLIPCPYYQTLILEKCGVIRNGATQVIKDDGVALAPEYLNPINMYGYGKATEQTFSIHKYAGTWIDKGIKDGMNREAQNYQTMAEIITAK